jgi:hypothetical protein
MLIYSYLYPTNVRKTGDYGNKQLNLTFEVFAALSARQFTSPMRSHMTLIRTLAQVISFVFHPLLMLTYMLVLLLIINPYLFGVSSLGEKAGKVLILQVFMYTFFIPAVSVLLFRALGLVKSIELEDRHDRIGPYILTSIFYLWLFYNLLHTDRLNVGKMQFSLQIPTAYTSFVLGATIALFLAFFINIFSKISAHAVGMGGLLGMVAITMMWFSYETFTVHSSILGIFQLSMRAVLIVTIVLAGLVGTARLILQARQPMDLYGGYLVGFASQFIALRFIF